MNDAKQPTVDITLEPRRNSRPICSGCGCKRPENRTAQEDNKLSTILQYNLKAARGFLLKADFQRFWDYRSAYWAGLFLDRWCTRAMRSRIEPMKTVAAMLRGHRGLILN